MSRLRHYVLGLNVGRMILWCYLIWYLVMAIYHFEASPRLWLTSLGISLVVGFGLVLSVIGPHRARLDHWQLMRLFLMPFCVSSFAALVKDDGFIVIFSPVPGETGLAIALCLGFVIAVRIVQSLTFRRRAPG